MVPANLIRTLEQMAKRLPKSERRVADVVRAHPEHIPQMSIQRLAESAGVSEPTVVRFCRSVGCEGFPDFKIRLAQSVITGGAHMHQAVEPGDTVDAALDKIFNATISVLSHVRDSLDKSVVARAVEMLAKARKVEFHGVGASGAVAIDAQHKFFRLDLPAVSYVDGHMQVMSAAAMGRGDVLVSISHTGRSASVVEAARMARHGGACVIAVTSPSSPLSGLAEFPIEVDAPEDTTLFTPMTSRIAHLAVVDVLAAGVALQRGEELVERMRDIKASLSGQRLPGDGEETAGSMILGNSANER